MQPVWRADRPQKGRYREFYQCDADVVGSNALLNEVELVSLYTDVFSKLQLPVEIRINNRKILAALASVCGGSDRLIDITIAIDKLDKIGIDKVKEELLQRGLNDEQVAIIENYLLIDGTAFEKISKVDALLGNTEDGKKGIEELSFILNYNNNSNLVPDFTLARGLNYYTGTIFEVKAIGVEMGSIGGGGRYDDLTGLFGVNNIPGVGISFGVDRIYDVLETLQLIPEDIAKGPAALFFNLGEAESRKAFDLMQTLRSNGVAAELYHEKAKFDKQFKYAEKKNIPYIIILGSEELERGVVKIKNLSTGMQRELGFEEVLRF
jgi:histidyl-tRNA synthetase